MFGSAWFLPGSFTLWLRSSYYDEAGLSPYSGLLFAAFLIVAVYFRGKACFEKKDVISLPSYSLRMSRSHMNQRIMVLCI